MTKTRFSLPGHVQAAPMRETLPDDPRGADDLAFDASLALRQLRERAKTDPKALAKLIRVTCEAVVDLNGIAKQHPEHVAQVATKRWGWPVMRSEHPHLSTDWPALVKAIKLGATSPIQSDKFSKWKPDFAADCAVALLKAVEATKPKSLAPFCKDNTADWWRLAEKLFLRSYPRDKIADIPALRGIVTTPSKRRSPGRIAQAVIETIHARFTALAPCQS